MAQSFYDTERIGSLLLALLQDLVNCKALELMVPLLQKHSGMGLPPSLEEPHHSLPYKPPLRQPTCDLGRFFALGQGFPIDFPSAGRARL